MIVMDRHNLFAPGWSHVVSVEGDIDELERLRQRIGAPPRALQLGNRLWPHLDLAGMYREAALRDADVIVVETSRDLIRFVRRQRAITSPP